MIRTSYLLFKSELPQRDWQLEARDTAPASGQTCRPLSEAVVLSPCSTLNSPEEVFFSQVLMPGPPQPRRWNVDDGIWASVLLRGPLSEN